MSLGGTGLAISVERFEQEKLECGQLEVVIHGLAIADDCAGLGVLAERAQTLFRSAHDGAGAEMDDASLRSPVDHRFEIFERDMALAIEPEIARVTMESEVADLVTGVAFLQPLADVVLQLGHGADVAMDVLDSTETSHRLKHRVDAPLLAEVGIPVAFECEHAGGNGSSGGIASGCGGSRT